MGFFDSPAKLRREALRRGADPSRWVPTYVDLGEFDGSGDVRMNYSFTVATPSDLLFFECDRELYGNRALIDPFKYAREYIGRVPITTVVRVRSGPVDVDKVTSSRQRGLWTDLAWNRTIGAVFGASTKSVAMAALVVFEVDKVKDSHKPHLVFGVPHKGDVGGLDFGFVGDLLPSTLSASLEIGVLAHEYAESGAADDASVVNAHAIARGVLTLMGRAQEAPTELLGIPNVQVRANRTSEH
jgi:hypothetical protein